MTPPPNARQSHEPFCEPAFHFAEWRLAGLTALTLTCLFWWPLWLGGGLIGGDLYSYALPQKLYLAEHLKQGILPLWHTWTGQGYPLLAESQAGVLYPLHWVTYGLFDVQTATNIVQIVHYLAAFLATWWMARWQGIGSRGATLSAAVYVFGWFPARASLDWAILGGIYLPLVIGCAEAYLQTQRWRYALGLAISIALQLLGGHFQLAFFTWLLLIVYVAVRVVMPFGPSSPFAPRKEAVFAERKPALCAVLMTAFGLGVLLAAVQLSATWELKTRSQRATVGGEHLPFYGHLPPVYLTQLAAPWWWYDATIDRNAVLNRLPGSVREATNPVEAHLYFGMIPLLLIVGGLIAQRRRGPLDRWTVFWLIVLLVAIVYATGWPLMVLQYVPGFNFFRGPGRSGIVATLGAGLLAGRAYERFFGFGSLVPSPPSAGERARVRGGFRSAPTPSRQPSPPQSSGPGGQSRRLLTRGIFWLTVADLWWTPRVVSDAVAVAHPPIRQREDSIVRQLLLDEDQPPRLFAPGQNLPNLLGVSALPVYLGLGPQEYFDPQYAMPKVEPEDFHTYSPERAQWLRDGGVTHILSFERLEPRGWPVEHIWTGFDRMLNPAWARFDQPVHLYRLTEARGRVSWADGVPGTATVTEYEPHRVRVTANSPNGGRLELMELAYPGWRVTVDGAPVSDPPTAGMFRAVDLTAGEHEIVWTYRPQSVLWGAIASAMAAFVLVALTVRSRRPRTAD